VDEIEQVPQATNEQSSLTDRAYAWLAPIWLFYVLAAFFVIRILGSGLAHRFLNLAQAKFGR